MRRVLEQYGVRVQFSRILVRKKTIHAFIYCGVKPAVRITKHVRYYAFQNEMFVMR